MKAQIEAAVKDLSAADTASLYAKLGAYARAFPSDPAQFATPEAAVQVDEEVAGPLDDAIILGKRILARWQKSIYDLVCGGESVDPEARKTIMNSLNLNSPEALAAAITGVLISAFSVVPAVAVIVGVLFGKILLPAAGKEVCQFWKEKM
jgi:hypothetical protein